MTIALARFRETESREKRGLAGIRAYLGNRDMSPEEIDACRISLQPGSFEHEI